MQAELQNENDDDEEDNDDDEDIDENLFFGIPEQRSPELATCTHCKGKWFAKMFLYYISTWFTINILDT